MTPMMAVLRFLYFAYKLYYGLPLTAYDLGWLFLDTLEYIP
jgi:hypothetical protein